MKYLLCIALIVMSVLIKKEIDMAQVNDVRKTAALKTPAFLGDQAGGAYRPTVKKSPAWLGAQGSAGGGLNATPTGPQYVPAGLSPSQVPKNKEDFYRPTRSIFGSSQYVPPGLSPSQIPTQVSQFTQPPPLGSSQYVPPGLSVAQRPKQAGDFVSNKPWWQYVPPGLAPSQIPTQASQFSVTPEAVTPLAIDDPMGEGLGADKQSWMFPQIMPDAGYDGGGGGFGTSYGGWGRGGRGGGGRGRYSPSPAWLGDMGLFQWNYKG